MAILIEPIELEIPSADILVGPYGNSALIYVYSSDAEDGTFSLVDDIAIVSGTEVYSLWDDSPVGGDSTWYKVRIGNGSDFSGYSDPFQVGSPAYGYTTGDLIGQRLGGRAGSADDGDLTAAASAANAEVIGYMGTYIGPRTDTSATFDGCDAVRNQTRLYIPGFIRSVSAIQMGWWHNDTTIAGTTTDLFLGPHLFSLPPGSAYWYIDLQWVTGALYLFPPYRQNVLITGDFGLAANPGDVVDITTQLGMWKWMTKQGGTVITTGDFEGGIFPYLTKPQKAVLDQWSMRTGVA